MPHSRQPQLMGGNEIWNGPISNSGYYFRGSSLQSSHSSLNIIFPMPPRLCFPICYHLLLSTLFHTCSFFLHPLSPTSYTLLTVGFQNHQQPRRDGELPVSSLTIQGQTFGLGQGFLQEDTKQLRARSQTRFLVCPFDNLFSRNFLVLPHVCLLTP